MLGDLYRKPIENTQGRLEVTEMAAHCCFFDFSHRCNIKVVILRKQRGISELARIKSFLFIDVTKIEALRLFLLLLRGKKCHCLFILRFQGVDVPSRTYSIVNIYLKCGQSPGVDVLRYMNHLEVFMCEIELKSSGPCQVSVKYASRLRST